MIESNYSGTPTPEVNSNKKKVLFLVLGVIVLVSVIFLVVFLVRKNHTANPTPVSPQTTATTTPQPIVDRFPSDADRDGIDDKQEKELGISNKDFDTDGDGLSDADEINVWHSDPKKKDTDGDTFSDGYEVIKGYDPNGAGKLNQ